MQKATKKVQKKEEEIKNNLYPEGRKNGTRKDLCSKKKKRRKQTEKGKRKREMKNRSLKKFKGEDKPEERNKKRKR